MKIVLLVTALVFGVMVFMPFAAVLAQPWAQVWFGQQASAVAVGGGGGLIEVPTAPVHVPGGAMVTDVQRFLLARDAGWPTTQAITAVAISIAEDGSGDPAALSGLNDNGTRDFCLWQLNSRWWPRFGGQAALADPQACANAAHTIYGIQGWCAWSTFERNCGLGHTGAYLAFLGRAIAAAQQAGG